jgi:hypothetical protein
LAIAARILTHEAQEERAHEREETSTAQFSRSRMHCGLLGPKIKLCRTS